MTDSTATPTRITTTGSKGNELSIWLQYPGETYPDVIATVSRTSSVLTRKLYRDGGDIEVPAEDLAWAWALVASVETALDADEEGTFDLAALASHRDITAQGAERIREVPTAA